VTPAPYLTDDFGVIWAMAILNLYSKRKKQAESSGAPELYGYEVIPQSLRVQIVHIWRDALGEPIGYGSHDSSARWERIHQMMAREKGLFELSPVRREGRLGQCIDWFLQAETDDALDMIELTFRAMEVFVGGMDDFVRREQGIRVAPREAIQELNQRFLEHNLGYEYQSSKIIRKDNEYIHQEIVKPALSLIYGRAGFDKAVEEFLLAHEHHREGRDKDCIVAAQRSFESTLKAICTDLNWNYSQGDRLPELVKVLRANGLFPGYLAGGLDTYVAMLKTGLPGVRNSAGGHGDEPGAPNVPSYIASYALHLTASNIVLAVEAMNQLKAGSPKRGVRRVQRGRTSQS
jgi:hypothetical protein